MPPIVPLEADDEGEPVEPVLVDVSAPVPPVVEPCACEVLDGLEAVPCAVLSVLVAVLSEPVVEPGAAEGGVPVERSAAAVVPEFGLLVLAVFDDCE